MNVRGSAWDSEGVGPAGFFTRSAGSGREVVCVHGLGASSRYFRPLARELAPYARVQAMDLPGFGLTPGPDEPLDLRGLSLALADWLRAADVKAPLFVANSLGCQIVVDLAVHSPELLGPAVLIGPTMDRHARTVVRHAWRLMRDLVHEKPALLPLLAHDYARCGPRRYFATLHAGLADPVERKMHRLPAPTLVLRGGLDPIVPRHWAEELVAALPRGSYAEVSGVGHAVHYSRPGPVAELVRTLL